jgi:hypothetical protein
MKMSNNTNVVDTVTNTTPVKRGRGRPKGSKNKPKTTVTGTTPVTTTGTVAIPVVVDYASLR